MDKKEWGHLISILDIQDVSPQIQKVWGPSQYSMLPSDAAKDWKGYKTGSVYLLQVVFAQVLCLFPTMSPLGYK